jgi:hypothetical protein
MDRLKSHGIRLKKLIHLLMILLVLAGLLWLLYILSGRALCVIALRQIGELTNTKISHEAVDFHADGSVFIKRLVVKPYEDINDKDAILKAEAVYARFSIGSLFLLRPQLKVININEFVLNARYDLDTGKSNLSALKIIPPKNGIGRIPLIDLRSGNLQYTKVSGDIEKVAISVPFNLKFGFDEESREGYSFEITSGIMASGFAQSRLTGVWKKGDVVITGGISSADISDLEMAWTIDFLAAEFKYDRFGTYSLDLRIKNLQSQNTPALDKLALIGPIFLEKSTPFAALRKFFAQYQPFGRVDIELEAAGDFNHFSESTLEGNVFCRDVGLCYCKFQYPIEKLAGRIDFTKDSITLNNLTGKHDEVNLSFNGWTKGFGQNRIYDIRVTSESMSLDEDLYRALGPKRKELWSTFSPNGFASIDYRFTRQSESEKKDELKVKLLEAKALYRDFPYPLEDLTGELVFDNNSVVLSDLTSKTNESVIALNGRIEIRGKRKPLYDLSIKLKNLSLDSKLETSLPERQKKFYKQLNPSGLADGWIKLSTPDTGDSSYSADLSFSRGSLDSDMFNLSVTDISAKILFTPEEIEVKNFSGRYDEGLVSAAGKIWPGPDTGMSRYNMSINFEQSQLNDSLLDLLPESIRGNMPEFADVGTVDIAADLIKNEPNESVDYVITLNCHGNSVSLPQFEYPLTGVVGTLKIDKNKIELDKIMAELGRNSSNNGSPAMIRLSGRLNLVDNIFDSALLQLEANDISFNNELDLFLPQKIRPLYKKLVPDGKFDLDFNNVVVNRTRDGNKIIGFNGDINFKNCSFRISGDRTELNANVKTSGMFTMNDGFNNCHASVEDGTLKVRGKTFRDLQTKIVFDPQQRSWSTQELTADFYDGKLTGKFEIKRHSEQDFEYLLQAGFDDVSLKKFLSDSELEQSPENGYSSGNMNGSISVRAQLGDSSFRIGTCMLMIKNMQVGKLSPIAKLLQVLQLTEPKDYAFDKMFVDSYIRGNKMFVEKLDLSGQSYAFNGSGWINLQNKDIDLTLTARGRRSVNDNPSFLQSLTEGLGKAVVRTEITGSYNDPIIITKTLPVIEETFQILGTRPDKIN